MTFIFGWNCPKCGEKIRELKESTIEEKKFTHEENHLGKQWKP